MSFNRSDEFMRSEKGPDWFDEFLKQLASPNQEIISTIHDIKAETVQSLTDKYRSQVGLDLIANDSDKIVVTAAKSPKPISKRAANKPAIQDIPEVQQAVDSFCQHSGGTKSTHAILHNLRKMLGKENISYTDQELMDYINDRKKQFYNPNKDVPISDPGAAGTEKEYGDSAAEYANRGANQ